MREGFFHGFTDAHAHLPENPADDAAISVPANAKILLNAARAEDFPRVAALAEKFPESIVPAFGIHPWFAEEWSGNVKILLRKYISDTLNATIGEIGLDRCRGNAERQESVFREQLEIAAELGVPVSLHCVRAFGKLEEILRGFFVAKKLPPFLLHAYGGSAEQAKIFARLGGVFSNPRRQLPSECKIVSESDAPLRSFSK